MYQRLLREHLDDKRAYGESPQPPCGPQELLRVRERARAELGVDLPAAYLDLLKITNGLDSNGLVVYAHETTPIVGYEGRDMFVEGIVEANLGWREHRPHESYLVFAESGSSLFGYDVRDGQYKRLDRQSNTVVEALGSFEELLLRGLEDNRP